MPHWGLRRGLGVLAFLAFCHPALADDTGLPEKIVVCKGNSCLIYRHDRVAPKPLEELIKVIQVPLTFKLPDDSEPKVRVHGRDAVVIELAMGPTIVGREAVELPADTFPDVVALERDGRQLCSGIAIGPRQILTAAHCAGATRVRVSESEWRTVAAARARGDGIDAAILVTAEPLGLPVRPRAKSPDDEPANGLIRLIGFGAADRAGVTGAGTKRRIDAPVLGWRCTDRRAAHLGCRPGVEVAVPSSDADTCSGDSGGPALARAGDTWRLIAVTSRPIPTARSQCGGGGIYTHVGVLAPWIDEQLRQP